MSSPPSSSRNPNDTFGLTGLSAGSYKNPKTLTLEDAVVAPFDPRGPSLPPPCNFLVVTENVLTAAPAAQGGHRRFWDDALGMGEFKDLVADAFWFILKYRQEEAAEAARKEEEKKAAVDEEKKEPELTSMSMGGTGTGTGMGTGGNKTRRPLHKKAEPEPSAAKYQDPYFVRMSTNFVKMFEKISFSRKDYFYGHFGDIMALSILLCYTAAFNKSRNKMDSDFKQMLVDLTTEWTTGFRAAKRLPRDHWVMQFDLQEGGKSATQERFKQIDSAMSAAPGTPATRARNAKQKMMNLSKQNEKAEAAESHSRPVRLDHVLMHSPLMTVYLKQFGQLENMHLQVRAACNSASELWGARAKGYLINPRACDRGRRQPLLLPSLPPSLPPSLTNY
jgi:hypothetical protein